MRRLRFLLAGALAATGLSAIAAQPAEALASVGKFEQCERTTINSDLCTGWTGGNLISGYTENQVVPQRVQLDVDSAGSYSFTTTYDDLSGSKHIIDYLATYDYTVEDADPCQTPFPAVCGGTPSTWPMPSDGAARGPVVAGYNNVVSSHELPQADRQWVLYGGTITGSTLSHAAGTGSVTVNFTTTGPVTAVLAFGAHLALTGPSSDPRAWAEGASTVNGNAQLAASIGGAKTHNIKVGASTPPPPPAAFTITKTATPTAVAAGGQVTYTVTVTNTGGTAGAATFTDDYNNNVTGVTNPGGCTPGVGQMTCTTSSIAPGGQQVLTYTATMPSTFSGAAGGSGCTGTYPVSNTATLAGSIAAGGPGTATATVCVAASAAFGITKTASTSTPAPGASVTYTITVTNNGNAAGAATFTDDFDNRLDASITAPSGCTKSSGVLSCTTGSIAANGGTQVFTYTATMPTAFDGGTTCAGGYQVSNTATITGGPAATRTVCVQAAPDFTIAKAAVPTANPGQTVTYSLTVTNTGQASGSTSVVDDYDNRLEPTVPSGCTDDGDTLSCSTGTILAGGTKVFTYTASMPTSFSGDPGSGGCGPASYPVPNTATLANNLSASRTVCVGAAPVFGIEKSANPTSALPGQEVTYTVTVTNSGAAGGSTTFTDDYDDRLGASITAPAGCTKTGGTLSCSTGTVAAGGSKVFTYTATLPTTFGPASGGSGCATGTYPVGNSATIANGPSASATVCVTAAPAYTITKTADPTSATPNQVVTYTITVTNTGAAAGSTTFTDDFNDRITPGAVTVDPMGGGCSPTGTTNQVLSCSTGSLPGGGGQQTFTYSAAMPTTYSDADSAGSCGTGKFAIDNTATLSNGTTVGATVCVSATPTFLVDKSVSNESAEPGTSVTYTIVVTNSGSAAGSTGFSDDYDDRLDASITAPAGCTKADGKLTCTTGTILAQSTQTFTYTATVPATFTTDPAGGETCAATSYALTNTVTTVGGATDTATICVAASPRFEITKSAPSTDPGPGGSVTYTVIVTNAGTAPGSTTWTDYFDDRIEPSLPTFSGGGTCTHDADSSPSQSYACTTAVLAPDAKQTFTYTHVMPEAFTTGDPTDTSCAPGEYSVTNSASVIGGTVNTTDSVVICIAVDTDFSVSKEVLEEDIGPGDPITYVITVTNDGDGPGNTRFGDDFDDRLDPSNATSDPSGADCAPTEVAGNELFDCLTGVIQPGESQTFTYSATAPLSFSTQDEAGTEGCDQGTYPITNAVNVGDDGDSVTICVPAAPTLTVSKTADATTVSPGGVVEYTITVSNSGDAPGSTTFVDDFDDRVGGSITAPEGCTKADGELVCTTGAIEPGGSQDFVYTATMPATFAGEPGGGDCGETSYLVSNGVALANGETSGEEVCVTAAPDFDVTKVVDDGEADPGQTVEYTVTVTNNGNAAGSRTFVDDFDDRLDASITAPEGCTKADGELTCTSDVLGAGESQTFVYTAVLPTVFTGESGLDPCAPGEYSVENAVTIDEEIVASRTVCVDASPRLVVSKSVDDELATPGQSVRYSIVVENTGSVAGSMSFTDDYDNRLGSSITAPSGCEKSDGTLVCTTEVLDPGESQTFGYDATMPTTFTGASGDGTCGNGTYAVGNSVRLANGENDSVTVCVAAAPNVSLAKTATLDTTSTGSQLITYTLTYANTGSAEARNVVVTDPIPAGTAYVSCTGGCSNSGSSATWAVGSVAPEDGSGSVTVTVRVTTNQSCVITNTAQVSVDGGPTISSNTVTTNVTPQPDPTGAKANGSAVGLTIQTSGLLDLVGPLVGGSFTNNNTLTLSRASSSQVGVGGPATNSDHLLTAKIPANGSLVSAGVLTATSASSVTAAPAEARQTTVSEVAGLCLVPVAGICTVQSSTVRAVATTMANGGYASISTAGSAIENLRVVNTAVPVNLNQTTTIPLNALIFGKGSYVALNERTGTSGLAGNKYVADQTVAMIHVKITGALGLQAVEIFVARATAHSEFPKTLICAGAKNQSVSGHAYAARLYTGPLLADLLLGYTQISPLGGSETEHIAEVVIPRYGVIANAKVADTSSAGSFGPASSTARSWAEIAGDGTKPACVLSYVTDCVAKATVIRSEASSTANSAGSVSSSAGTQFLGLSVFGIPIAGTPAPNTTLPLPGIGFIVLNEQFCDNGGPSSGTCTGNPHSGITVRAIRVVITVANNILGLAPGIELVVSEAHADASFRSSAS